MRTTIHEDLRKYQGHGEDLFTPDETNREKDRSMHAERVRAMGCLVCGRSPSDPHHEPPRSRGGSAKNLAPLCRKHHRQRHALGSAAMFAHYYRIDLGAEASRIWEEAQ
jgi:hypothetical protein|tara:strand:+ start:6080 stop:6406 length:327 start_codon:yes stop_codon:yes gene_type:complete